VMTLLLCVPAPLFAASPTVIYFYNPENNINNFSSLKREFDSFFDRGGGALTLQPFNDRKIFEDIFAKEREGIFILSRWHFGALQKKYPLRAALVGVANGSTTQRTLLTARNSLTNMAQLEGMKVASAGSPAYSRSALTRIMGANRKKLIDSITIMPVPKDIDALMAVGFGMATAALTTESSLAKLEKINAKQYGMLTQLGEGAPSLLPIVGVYQNSGAGTQAGLKILREMGKSAEGKARLRILGLEAFWPLSAAQQEELRQ